MNATAARPAVAVGSLRVLRAGLVAAAMAAALVAAVPPALGQNSAPVPAPSGASAAPEAPPASTSSSSSTTVTPNATPPTDSQSSKTKSDPVCFKLTGHCVDSTKVAGAKPGSAAAKSGAGGKKPLNLTAPDVRTVVPEQELKQPLPNENQITEVQDSQTVSVATDEAVPVDVPGGLGAIWWAVSHPSQAWRILTPAE